jgi:hypothetical protein
MLWLLRKLQCNYSISLYRRFSNILVFLFIYPCSLNRTDNDCTTDSSHPDYNGNFVAYKKIPLVKYKKKKRDKILRKLLDKAVVSTDSKSKESVGHSSNNSSSSDSDGDSSIGIGDSATGDDALLPMHESGNGVASSSQSQSQSQSQSPPQSQLPSSLSPPLVTEEPIVPYWKPTLDISLVLDFPPFPRNGVPLIMGKVQYVYTLRWTMESHEWCGWKYFCLYTNLLW